MRRRAESYAAIEIVGRNGNPVIRKESAARHPRSGSRVAHTECSRSDKDFVARHGRIEPNTFDVFPTKE